MRRILRGDADPVHSMISRGVDKWLWMVEANLLQGTAIVNAVGPIRLVVQTSGPTSKRYLVIGAGSPPSMGASVQVQQ